MTPIEQAIEALTEASEIFQAQADDICPSLIGSAQRCTDAITALQSTQEGAVAWVRMVKGSEIDWDENCIFPDKETALEDLAEMDDCDQYEIAPLYTQPQSPVTGDESVVVSKTDLRKALSLVTSPQHGTQIIKLYSGHRDAVLRLAIAASQQGDSNE